MSRLVKATETVIREMPERDDRIGEYDLFYTLVRTQGEYWIDSPRSPKPVQQARVLVSRNGKKVASFLTKQTVTSAVLAKVLDEAAESAACPF